MRKHFLLTILFGLTAYLALPLPGQGSLDDRIQEKRNQIEHARGKEQVLTTEISGYSARIQTLQADIDDLQARQDRVQRDLDVKMARLQAIRDDLQISQDRLARLQIRLAHDRDVLSKQLVALYKDDRPDMVTVVLEADGFTDLLEQSEYIERITEQNEEIVERVRDTKREVAIETARLEDLEAEAEEIADAIRVQRDEIASAKETVVLRQDDLEQARGVRRDALSRIVSVRHEHEGDLKDLEAKQAEIQAAAAGVNVPGTPIRQGSGQFIWPVNGPVVSGFGQRWGRLHAGVDIAVPAGTPIRAAAAGTVTLMQSDAASGGYGNFTCITHAGGISTCYAHQSSFATSSGASVSQGQVIGSVGCTGHCYGDHLHFEVRIGGAPVDPMGYL
jgi:murein DD-endopeptidase MepM/ murein hydrolase activator NlpD